jgi:hypothetical protein
MRMRWLLSLVVVSASVIWAQDKPPEPRTRAIIQVRNVSAKDLARLVSASNVEVTPDDAMKVIVVSGPSSAVATIEDLARKLDVAPPAPPARPNIELMGYLVFGSPQAKADDVPAEIAPAIKQLRGSFQYKSYRMLDSFVVRARHGQNAQTTGLFPVAGEDAPAATYQFAYKTATVSDGNPRVVHIDGMDLRVRIPTLTVYTDKEGNKNKSYQYIDGRLDTNIDVREGQKVVVGKSNINANDDAMILILTAKVVE